MMNGVLAQTGVLSGSIISLGTLSGSIVSNGILTGTVIAPTMVPLPEFEGSYTVVPKIASQTLDTQLKSMYNNVEVTGIPYYAVSNPQGGSTIIIGGND